MTVTLTNPQLSENLEYLTVDTDLLTVQKTAHQITLSGKSSVDDPVYVTALLSIEYHNDADEPNGTTREILISIFDGKFYNSPLTRVMIEITTFNDAPIIEPSGEKGNKVITAEYNEGTEKEDAPFLAPNLVVRDSDSEYLVMATVNLEEIFDSGNETIFMNTSLLAGTGISCDPVSCEGESLTLTGNAAPSVYQTLLRSLKYVNGKKVSDFPSLFDRYVKLITSDGNSNSSSDVQITIDIIPLNPRVIIDLDTPNHDYFISYIEESGQRVAIVGNSRVVDISLTTLQSIIIHLREPALESEEKLILDDTCVTNLGISAENLQSIKQIRLGEGGLTTDDYRKALECITYENTEDEPKNITRYIDFLFVPGGGAPNDTATTEITFLYENDNPPVCNGSAFVDLPEDTKIGVVFHTLEAMDKDVGFGDSDIGYTFLSGNELNLFNLSTTDNIASLFLNSLVDFESNVTQYSVVIQACDMGTPSFCCNYSITFDVIDVNDNSPVFVDEPITVTVNENEAKEIAIFDIRDADSGINANLSSIEINSVSPSGCIGLFETALSPPSLSTVSPGVDFETTPRCYIVIIATDAGDPMLSTSTNVTVVVNDQDDKPPVFLPPFNFNVPENNTFPLTVDAVRVMDPDSNATDLVFSLINTDSNQFRIDQDSGELEILFTTDLSIADSYTVTVHVEDPAGNSAEQSYSISVLPVNNDPPTLVLNSVPVLFVEESGIPVTLQSNPSISDPDNVTLAIDRIYASIANGMDSTKEKLSVKSGSPSHVIGSTDDPFEIVILPTDQENITSIETLIQNIEYLNTEDEPSLCRSDKYPCSSNYSRTILISVSDTTFVSNREPAIVNFEFINDLPVIDLDTSGDRLIEFEEGSPPTQIVSSISYEVSDDDNEDLESLMCSLQNALDGDKESLLILGDTPSDLAVSGNNTHSIEITGVSSVDSYKTVLGLLFYHGTSSNPNVTLNRYVSCVASDGTNTSVPATATITYQEINDVPHVTLNENLIAYEEEMGPVLISTNPVITDVDDSMLSSMTVELVGVNGTEHVLSLNKSLLGGLSYTSTNSSVKVFGNAVIATFEKILESVTYENKLLEFLRKNEFFTIRVIIEDESGGFSSPAELSVILLSVDDNPPIFDPNTYQVSISENEPIGTVVVNVTVTDADLPDPETPTFSFTKGNSFGHFTISNNPDDSLRGRIRIKESLDYNIESSYQLVVQAISGSSLTIATVNISVINENNKNILFFNFPGSFQVYESQDSSVPLIPPQVIAQDPDNFPITYSIVSPYVKIDPVTGELTTIPPVDREGVPGVSFTIAVTATDGVSSVTEEANVTVLDSNEFNPVFDETSYNVTIEENSAPPDSPIVSVHATDADEEPDLETIGTLITYSLSPSLLSGYFMLNATTGDLYLMNELDYEESAKIILEVIASDNSVSSPLSSTVLVTVTVNDINDEPPFFVNPLNEYIVKEHPLTDFDLTITGDDQDTDKLLWFNISSSIEDLPFSINTYTGKVMRTAQLDADTGIREYDITVLLTDITTEDGYNDTASHELVIIVQDVNDNAPIFEKNLYTYEVKENLPIVDSVNGDALFTVKATDADYGFDPSGESNGNKNVTYSLLGAPNDTFRIDPISGIIYKLKSLNRESEDEHIFYVIGSDNPVSESPSTGMAKVIIRVLDVNEHPPVADPNQYYVNIKESVAANSELETLVSVEWSTTGKCYRIPYSIT